MTEREKTQIQLSMVQRAEALGIINKSVPNPKFTLLLDIDNSIPKEALDILKKFNDADFIHDIVGIQVHINRDTHELDNDFTPRCVSILEEKRNIGVTNKK